VTGLPGIKSTHCWATPFREPLGLVSLAEDEEGFFLFLNKTAFEIGDRFLVAAYRKRRFLILSEMLPSSDTGSTSKEEIIADS
jgi:hypothetical protein